MREATLRCLWVACGRRRSTGERGPALDRPFPQKAPVIFGESVNEDDDDDDIEVVEASSPLGIAPAAESRFGGAGGVGKLARDLAGEVDVDVDREQDEEDEGVRLGSRRAKAGGVPELTAIQEGVQALNKAAQPLGRAMDYLQEDIDGMVKEASFW